MKIYKHFQLFVTFSLFFSLFIQTNALIATSAAHSPIPMSYISSAPRSPLSTSSSSFTDRDPDPLIPKSYISSSPSTSPNANDVNKVLESQFSTMNRDTQLAIVVSQKILKNPSTTILIRKCLGQCVENYNTIVDDITKATNDLHANDIYMVKEDLSSIEDDISACQSCFEDMIGGSSPLKSYDDTINGTASHCLEIIAQTKKFN